MIKAVIFDCFGVLVIDNWSDFASSLPHKQDQEEAHDLGRQCNLGLIDEQEFFERIAILSGKKSDDLKHLLLKGNKKNLRLLDFITSLRQQGTKIGLISNIGSPWIRTDLLTPAEQQLFDDMVLSFEVGIAKPDPKIFELACQNLGIKPSEALFTDDIKDYCNAAEAIGISAVHYKHFDQAKRDILSKLHHE